MKGWLCCGCLLVTVVVAAVVIIKWYPKAFSDGKPREANPPIISVTESTTTVASEPGTEQLIVCNGGKCHCKVPEKEHYVFVKPRQVILDEGTLLEQHVEVHVYCKDAGFGGEFEFNLHDNVALTCDNDWNYNVAKLNYCKTDKCLLPVITNSNITKQTVITAGEEAEILCTDRFYGRTYEIPVTCKTGGVIEDLARANCQGLGYEPCVIPEGEHYQFIHYGRLSRTLTRFEYFSLVCDPGYKPTQTLSSVYCERSGLQAIVESTTQSADGPLHHSVHTKLPRNFCVPK